MSRNRHLTFPRVFSNLLFNRYLHDVRRRSIHFFFRSQLASFKIRLTNFPLCDKNPEKSRGIQNCHWSRSFKRHLCYIQQVFLNLVHYLECKKAKRGALTSWLDVILTLEKPSRKGEQEYYGLSPEKQSEAFTWVFGMICTGIDLLSSNHEN